MAGHMDDHDFSSPGIKQNFDVEICKDFRAEM